MPLPDGLERVRNQTGMYLLESRCDLVIALIQGYDLANGGGLLTGFREWLIVKNGYGHNLSWNALAMELVSRKQQFSDENIKPCDEAMSIAMLFDLLEEFLREKEVRNGLRQIYSRFEIWLRHQAWYSPKSPEWIEQ